jgi:hypothetical protein
MTPLTEISESPAALLHRLTDDNDKSCDVPRVGQSLVFEP